MKQREDLTLLRSLKWEEVFLFPTPLTHAGGCFMLPVFLRKGRCVIIDHFEPKLFLDTIEKDFCKKEMLKKQCNKMVIPCT